MRVNKRPRMLPAIIMSINTVNYFRGMEILEEQGMVGRDLICPRCGRKVARIIDDVYMKIDNAIFYESVRFTCLCHKPLWFRVRNFEKNGFHGETKKILGGLGNGNKHLAQKVKKKR